VAGAKVRAGADRGGVLGVLKHPPYNARVE